MTPLQLRAFAEPDLAHERVVGVYRLHLMLLVDHNDGRTEGRWMAGVGMADGRPVVAWNPAERHGAARWMRNLLRGVGRMPDNYIPAVSWIGAERPCSDAEVEKLPPPKVTSGTP